MKISENFDGFYTNFEFFFSKIGKNGSVIFGYIVKHMLNNKSEIFEFLLNLSFVFFLSQNVKPNQKNFKF
jgi:hypothetical protein